MKRQKHSIKLAFILLIHLCIMNRVSYANLQEENGDLGVSTSMHIPEGINMVINGGLLVNHLDFKNSGKIIFVNRNDANSYFSTDFNASGLFSFEGTGNHYLEITGDSKIGSLIMRSSGLLELSGELKVSNNLSLHQGLIITENGGLITLESSDEQSLTVDESPNGESYIVGPLARKVKSNGNYFFPIGNQDNRIPLFLLDVKNDDVVVAEFNPHIPNDITIFSQSHYTLLEDKGWIIKSKSLNDNQFKLALFIDEIDNPSDGYGILHAQLNDYSQISADYNSSYGVNGYISNINKVEYGAFAIAESEKINLPNFLFAGLGEESKRFRIPESDRYSNIQLVVFDRMGKQVYRNLNYYDEFIATDYPGGTYYYELTLSKGNDEKKLYNFIEIKNEK